MNEECEMSRVSEECKRSELGNGVVSRGVYEWGSECKWGSKRRSVGGRTSVRI